MTGRGRDRRLGKGVPEPEPADVDTQLPPGIARTVGRRRLNPSPIPNRPGLVRPGPLGNDAVVLLLRSGLGGALCLLAALLDVGLALSGLSFGLEPLVAGHLPGRLLDLAFRLLTGVLRLLGGRHRGTSLFG